MRVLVACEHSGVVREAFARRGHDAVSCDLLPDDMALLPGEQLGRHHEGDVTPLLAETWDLMVAHPPCTYLAVSGAIHFERRRPQQASALEFVRLLMRAQIERIAIENPVSVISTAIRKPDQVIHPWQFGHPEEKTTCLWLKNLPPLRPTSVVDSKRSRVLSLPPSRDRWKIRSRTYQGIAEAMAEQWGG